MEKDPAKRFDSAGSFAEALRAARTWPEEDARASLQRVIHDDFSGDGMPQLLGLETLRSRDAAWRAGGARTALGSSRPPALTRRESGTVTANVPNSALPDPMATIQALPSSALLELARAGGGGEATIVAKPEDLPVPAVPQATPPKRRGGLLLGLGGAAVLVAGAAAYTLLKPKEPPPAPRFLLIEKQADAPGETPAASASASSPAAPNAAPSSTAAVPGLAASGANRPPKPGEAGSSGSSLSSAFQRQRGRVEACFRSHAADLTEQPQLTVRFQITATGAVQSAELIPAGMSGSPLGACILGVARSTKFPAGDAPVSFTIPITARKTGG